MAQVAVNGITIEYERRGSGEPLLLVMGLAGQLVAWPDAFVDKLVAQGFDVIWYDNRDVGLSTKIDAPVPSLSAQLGFLPKRRRQQSAPYLLADMAQDAVGLLDVLQVEAAHVVGVSMGGMISQTIAINHPDRVLSLTSIMSNTGDKRHGLPSARILNKLRKLTARTADNAIESQVELFRLIGGPLVEDDVVRESATVAFNRDYDPDGVARQTAAIGASPNRTSGLTKLSVPTLVIHGMADTLVGFSGGVATAKAVPNARLLAFPDMGHDLPRARWDEMVEAIVANSKRVPK